MLDSALEQKGVSGRRYRRVLMIIMMERDATGWDDEACCLSILLKQHSLHFFYVLSSVLIRRCLCAAVAVRLLKTTPSSSERAAVNPQQSCDANKEHRYRWSCGGWFEASGIYTLFEAVSNCLNSTYSMNGKKNHALSELLDGNDDSTSPLTANGIVENGNLDDRTAKAVYEEHLGRLKAEAEAEDSSRRLAVAQTQLTEYSLQKSEDVAELETEAETMAQLFGQFGSNVSDPALLKKLSEQMETLKAKIREISGEARAFAMQQKADLQRSQGVITQISALPADETESDQLEELSSDMDTSPVGKP